MGNIKRDGKTKIQVSRLVSSKSITRKQLYEAKNRNFSPRFWDIVYTRPRNAKTIKMDHPPFFSRS